MENTVQEQIINEDEEIIMEPWEEEQVLKGEIIGDLEPINFAGFLLNKYRNDPIKTDAFGSDLILLSQPIQDFLISADVFLELKFIGSKSNLNPDQVKNLISITINTVLGNQFLGDFVKNIQTNLGIDQQKSKLLADDISASLFAGIANELKGIQNQRFSSKIADLKKTIPSPQQDPIISSQSGFGKPGGPANIQGSEPKFQNQPPKPSNQGPPSMTVPQQAKPVLPTQTQPSRPQNVSPPNPQPSRPQGSQWQGLSSAGPQPTPRPYQDKAEGGQTPPRPQPTPPTPRPPQPPRPSTPSSPPQQTPPQQARPVSPTPGPQQNQPQTPSQPRPGQDVNQPKGTVKVIDLSQLGK